MAGWPRMMGALDAKPGLLGEIIGPHWTAVLLADTVASMTEDQRQRYAKLRGEVVEGRLSVRSARAKPKPQKPNLRAWRRSLRFKAEVEAKDG